MKWKQYLRTLSKLKTNKIKNNPISFFSLNLNFLRNL